MLTFNIHLLYFASYFHDFVFANTKTFQGMFSHTDPIPNEPGPLHGH